MVVALAQQDGAGTFVDWGVLHVSVTNLAVIGAMVVLFVLALVVPFPSHRAEDLPRLVAPEAPPAEEKTPSTADVAPTGAVAAPDPHRAIR